MNKLLEISLVGAFALVAGINTAYSGPTEGPTGHVGDNQNNPAPRPTGTRMDENNRLTFIGDAEDEDTAWQRDNLVFRLQYANGQATITLANICFSHGFYNQGHRYQGMIFPIAPALATAVTTTVNDVNENIRNSRLNNLTGVAPDRILVGFRDLPQEAKDALMIKLREYNDLHPELWPEGEG